MAPLEQFQVIECEPPQGSLPFALICPDNAIFE
jgi:hypothetical protein